MRTPNDQKPPRRSLDALLDCLVDDQSHDEARAAIEAILARQADRHDPENVPRKLVA